MDEIAEHIKKAYEHMLEADKLLDQIPEDGRQNSALKMFFKEHIVAHETYVEWTKQIGGI